MGQDPMIENADSDQMQRIEHGAELFLKRNYNYTFLKGKLEQAIRESKYGERDATLITGSSHALYGIHEAAWRRAFNCSMHSQDLYYDFACAKYVIEKGGRFKRCIIVLGYYIAYQDLSLSEKMRGRWVSQIFYPIFRDARNWKEPIPFDPQSKIEEVPENLRAACEERALQIIGSLPYFSNYKKRRSMFDFKGKAWQELSDEEKDKYGIARAVNSHGRLIRHTESYLENQQVFNEYINYLQVHGIQPILCVTPFSDPYNKHLDSQMKEGLFSMVNARKGDVSFVDFNNFRIFSETDFVDTDHLSLDGSKKISRILVEIFGA